jgi:transglycosylase-like protein
MHLEEEIPRPATLPIARVAPTKEAKTARWLLVLIPTTLLALIVGTRLFVVSEYASRSAADYIAQELARRAHATVQLSGVTFGYDFAPCFNDFEIFRFTGAYKLKATTKRACVERWASAVGSGFHAIRIRLAQPSIEIEGSRTASGAKALADVKPRELSSAISDREKNALREIQVVFDDLRLDWKEMPFPERFATGSFGPIDGTVALQIRNLQTAATLFIREPSTGSTINGRVNPIPEGWDMSAGVEGDIVPIFGNLLAATELDIRKMPTRGRLGAVYSAKRHAGTIDLDLEQSDLDVANQLVSANRLTGFSAREKARLEIDFDRSVAEMKDGIIGINGIPVTLSFDLRPGARSPAFDMRAELKTTPLIRLLRSVPDAREPEFAKSLSPDVLFAFNFEMSGQLRDPTTWQPKLENRLTGIGSNGAGSGLEFLRSTFRYYPLTREGRSETGRLIGPDTAGWVSFRRIPYIQKRAVIISEDSTFYFHHGIDIAEIQDAISKGLTTGEKARGGSTLTQQLVKNLFLTRDRTALRKLQELLLTFHVESSLTKDQIFELYLNIIEWGPDIYGLKEASWHYFGKKPESLSPREMCFLAVIIPAPVSSHQQYESGYVSARTNAKIDSLLERLNRLGQLSNDAYQEAKSTKIRFVRRKEK